MPMQSNKNTHNTKIGNEQDKWYRSWYKLPWGSKLITRSDKTSFIRYNEGYEEEVMPCCANQFYLAKIPENTEIINEDGKYFVEDIYQHKTQVYTTEYARGFTELVDDNGNRITPDDNDQVYTKNEGYDIYNLGNLIIHVISRNEYNEKYKNTRGSSNDFQQRQQSPTFFTPTSPSYHPSPSNCFNLFAGNDNPNKIDTYGIECLQTINSNSEDNDPSNQNSPQ